MFKQLKMKLAARKIKTSSDKKNAKKSKDVAKKTKAAAKKAPANKKSKPMNFWARVWKIILYPFIMIGKGLAHFWNWVRSIDLIGLVNITLLIAIITLFSMLIMDIYRCNTKTVVFVTPADISSEAVKTAETVGTIKTIRQITVTEAEFRKNNAALAKNNKKILTLPFKKGMINVGKSDKINNVKNTKIFGDVIIDGRDYQTKVTSETKVQGNLYLQNMIRYNLPCDIHVDGNLFVRNVKMLKFCGKFTVTGNIYVTKNSSFGPIPKNAKLSGQIIF